MSETTQTPNPYLKLRLDARVVARETLTREHAFYVEQGETNATYAQWLRDQRQTLLDEGPEDLGDATLLFFLELALDEIA